MLKKLKIKNVALIDEVEIDFEKGLNILSGETGSGKSVIIESLNFVLGAKADKTLISSGKEYAIVSAEFDITGNKTVKNILKDFDIDEEETLIVTRKMTVDSRNDIKVNGNTLTSSMLKKVTTHLVDIHGQSEHFYLLKEANQLNCVDKYAGIEIDEIKQEIFENYNKFKEVDKKLQDLGGDESSRAIRMDILSFQIKEIEDANLKDGEEDELLMERKRLQNQQKIMNALNSAYYALSADGATIDTLHNALSCMNSISDYSTEYSNICDRLDSVKTELDDIIDALSGEKDSFDFDGNSLEFIEERLDLIKKLRKKYGSNYNEIMQFLSSAKEEYDKLSHFEELSQSLVLDKDKYENLLYKNYKQLSHLRRLASQRLANSVTNELAELGMVNAVFAVDFNEFPDIDSVSFNSVGVDSVSFMFSANKGEPLKPLAKIISGGEISRFMLAVKTVTSKLQDLSTFVFDEIDAGISGRIAETVAEKFAKISLDTQILAITHLPQITAMADTSFLIYKTEVNEKTKSLVSKLNEERRIDEISRIIGGSSIDEVSKTHAKNLISKAQEFKKKLKK